eukprot:8630669-Lingulodinium_polyedra.AAC.1
MRTARRVLTDTARPCAAQARTLAKVNRQHRTWAATLQTAAPSSKPPRPELSEQRTARARKAAKRSVGAT